MCIKAHTFLWKSTRENEVLMSLQSHFLIYLCWHAYTHTHHVQGGTHLCVLSSNGCKIPDAHTQHVCTGWYSPLSPQLKWGQDIRCMHTHTHIRVHSLVLTSRSSASKGTLRRAMMLAHTGIKISSNTERRRSLYLTTNWLIRGINSWMSLACRHYVVSVMNRKWAYHSSLVRNSLSQQASTQAGLNENTYTYNEPLNQGQSEHSH